MRNYFPKKILITLWCWRTKTIFHNMTLH